MPSITQESPLLLVAEHLCYLSMRHLRLLFLYHISNDGLEDFVIRTAKVFFLVRTSYLVAAFRYEAEDFRCAMGYLLCSFGVELRGIY